MINKTKMSEEFIFFIQGGRFLPSLEDGFYFNYFTVIDRISFVILASRSSSEK